MTKYKNLEHFIKYLFKIGQKKDFDANEKEIRFIFDYFEKNHVLCPSCGKDIILGRTEERGWLDFVCKKCGWADSDVYYFMAKQICNFETKPRAHRHTYKKMTVGSICAKCGHWK